MEDRLSCLFSDIGDHAVAVKPELLCQLGNDREHVADNRFIFGGNRRDRRNMSLRDYQKMRGCLRINVIKGITQIVLIDLFRGDLSRCNVAE